MASKIKIAFFIDGFLTDLGGTEGQLLQILRRLDREIFDPFLIVLNETPWSRGRELPCPRASLDYRGFLKPSFPGVVARLGRLLKEKDFDIVHTFFNESTMTAWFASFLTRPRALLSSRRDTGMGASLPWYHAVYGRLMPWVNRRFNGIVANGALVKEHVVSSEGVPAEKVRVIYNGVDLPPTEEAAPPLFRGVKTGFWVGATANLKKVKRLDLLLDALALLRDRHGVADFHALFLGEGDERAALEAQAARLGLTERTHFPGAVRDVTAHVQRLDAAVLCSDREGLSNAILEYMACGRPVVATAAGETPALVDDSNGALVPCGDAPALADALARLARDPALRARMGARSREKIEARFSWPRAMAALETYYKELAEARA